MQTRDPPALTSARLTDSRQMTGQLLAFDKVSSACIAKIHVLLTRLQHMNLVLGDTDEFRRIKRKQTKPSAPGASSSTATQTVETEEKRTLGLTILRGAQIVSLSVESAPPADPSTRLGKSTVGSLPTGLTSGPGVSRPAGRGAAPTSLAVSFQSLDMATFTADILYRVRLLESVAVFLLLSLSFLARLALDLDEVAVSLPWFSTAMYSLLTCRQLLLPASPLGASLLRAFLKGNSHPRASTQVVVLQVSTLPHEDKRVLGRLVLRRTCPLSTGLRYHLAFGNAISERCG